MKNVAAKMYDIDEYPQKCGWYVIEIWQSGKFVESFIRPSKKLADEQFDQNGYVRFTFVSSESPES